MFLINYIISSTNVRVYFFNFRNISVHLLMHKVLCCNFCLILSLIHTYLLTRLCGNFFNLSWVIVLSANLPKIKDNPQSITCIHTNQGVLILKHLFYWDLDRIPIHKRVCSTCKRKVNKLHYLRKCSSFN